MLAPHWNICHCYKRIIWWLCRNMQKCLPNNIKKSYVYWLHLCRNYAYEWINSKSKHKENTFWLGYRIIRCFKVTLSIMQEKKKFMDLNIKKIWPKKIDKNNHPWGNLSLRFERTHFQNNEKGIMAFRVKIKYWFRASGSSAIRIKISQQELWEFQGEFCTLERSGGHMPCFPFISSMYPNFLLFPCEVLGCDVENQSHTFPPLDTIGQVNSPEFYCILGGTGEVRVSLKI